ncbi:hypothetical protein J6590_011879 [Homalodisca vitripennis]|nr:hypothetical protein J6590_011879 [Homalodisca vitripennis]
MKCEGVAGTVPGDPSFIILSQRPHIAPTVVVYIRLSCQVTYGTAALPVYVTETAHAARRAHILLHQTESIDDIPTVTIVLYMSSEMLVFKQLNIDTNFVIATHKCDTKSTPDNIDELKFFPDKENICVCGVTAQTADRQLQANKTSVNKTARGDKTIWLAHKKPLQPVFTTPRRLQLFYISLNGSVAARLASQTRPLSPQVVNSETVPRRYTTRPLSPQVVNSETVPRRYTTRPLSLQVVNSETVPRRYTTRPLSLQVVNSETVPRRYTTRPLSLQVVNSETVPRRYTTRPLSPQVVNSETVPRRLPCVPSYIVHHPPLITTSRQHGSLNTHWLPCVPSYIVHHPPLITTSRQQQLRPGHAAHSLPVSHNLRWIQVIAGIPDIKHSSQPLRRPAPSPPLHPPPQHTPTLTELNQTSHMNEMAQGERYGAFITQYPGFIPPSLPPLCCVRAFPPLTVRCGSSTCNHTANCRSADRSSPCPAE